MKKLLFLLLSPLAFGQSTPVLQQGTTNGVALYQSATSVGSAAVDTTTTHALFATAGAPAFRALGAGDIPTAIPIANIGSAGLSGTAPMAIGATGAISITGAAGQVLAGASPAFTATPALGTDASVAGTLTLSNGAGGGAHTIFSSGATTTNTIAGFAAVPTTGHIVDCTVASTTCTLHDSGIVTANVVNASSPGAGIAHFAGSTQTVTSSAVVSADITSLAESKLTGSAAATTITEAGTGDAITRSGVETGNLTAPYVFVNTNSTNNNTSIGLGITTPGTSTGQTTLNVNGATTGGDLADFGTGGTWAAGVLSGQTIVAKIGITGAATVLSLGTGTPPSCTAGTGGVYCAGEGTAPTTASAVDQIYGDSTAHTFRAQVNGGSPAVVVLALPGSIRSTGLVASVSTATLCAASAGACLSSGLYHVHVSMYQSGSACSANTTNGVSFQLTWTDGNGTAHSARTIPVDVDAGAIGTSGVMAWNATTLGAWASGDVNIDSNGSIIQYATTYANCTTGTATYALSASVTRLQ